MLTPRHPAWFLRGASFGLWALAAASAVFWGLKLGGTQRPVALPPPAAPQVAAVDPVALGRLLGGTPSAGPVAAAAPSLASRFRLLGVAAGVESGRGGAVISVDGKPPRSYRVGAMIEEGVMLQSVHGSQAVLAASATGPALVTLEVPAPAAGAVPAPAVGVQRPIGAPA